MQREKVIIVRYCEIHLKGKNRGYFEKVFMVNLEKALAGIRHEMKKTSGRYLVEKFDESCTDEITERLRKVFGTHSLSIGYLVPADMEAVYETVLLVAPKSGSFKIQANRGDKSFSLNSMQINAQIGGRLLADNPSLRVDVHTPQTIVSIDIREEGNALVFAGVIKGAGGMPVGTSGKGLLLLSGGIDSPVAGYMIAKRGMKIEAIHFHSYPYTNMQAREKVEELAKILAVYTGGIELNIVSVTHIQEAIHRHCPDEMMITLLRRFMMRIAERVARERDAQCIITGESLGQVASQTIEGMTSSNAVVSMPVLRPLVGFDKTEIIERARDIGSYETSVLPYEDCCTVFLPKHPLIRPDLKKVEEAEKRLDIDALVSESLAGLERVNF